MNHMSAGNARLLLAFFLLIAVCSCATVKTEQVNREKGDSDVADKVSREAHSLMSAGLHWKAVQTYAEAFHRYPENRALRNGYISTAQHVRDVADSALEKAQFATAGHIYGSLYRSSLVKDIGNALSLDSDYLLKGMKRCSHAMNEKGIEKYREGRLDDAVAIWKAIVSFDPDNAEVKKAITTASIQIRNLKRIE